MLRLKAETILVDFKDVGNAKVKKGVFSSEILNSRDFGVPQNREGVFVVGHLGGESGREISLIEEADRGHSQLEKQREPVSKTLLARGQECNAGMILIGEGIRIRRLTPVECERLQGFPDGWMKESLTIDGKVVGMSDTRRYRALGNA